MGGRCYGDAARIKHFRADAQTCKRSNLTGEHRFVEVRYDEAQETSDPSQWTVDEICTTQIHLETMDEDLVWMDVNGLAVWFRAVRVKGQRQLRILVTCHADVCQPYVVKPGEGTLENGPPVHGQRAAGSR